MTKILTDFAFRSQVLNNQKYHITHEDALKLSVPERHLLVSLIPTPEEFIEEKPGSKGAEYVGLEYMREIAWYFYGGFSFTVRWGEPKLINNAKGDLYASVTADLEWYEDNKLFIGSMWDAHRAFDDIGDACKSAMTDCEKKALNQYLNISDDVYRKTGTLLPDDHREALLKLYSEIEKWPSEQYKLDIRQRLENLNRGNFRDIAGKLVKLMDSK